ncbi:MAG: hypothetical protein K6G84_02260 [Lachnospiraceae bacterium]|nr:hypothetical protein [Lachnospiraceae bacterium]
MIRKKTLSLIIAVSMIFSTGNIVFANENTAETYDVSSAYTVDDTVDSEAQISDNAASANAKAQSTNIKVVGIGGKKDLVVEYKAAAVYTGKKIKASDLEVTVSINGYLVDAKAIKITGNNKDVSTGNTFKITSVASSYKNIRYANSYNGAYVYDKNGSLAAKSALRNLRADFNSYLKKSDANKFSFEIDPIYIKDAVTYSSLKSVSKNALVTYDPEYKNTAVVTIKNGSIKKVQVLVKGAKRSNGTYKTKKYTLKKNTDYTINGTTITFTGSNVAYTTAIDISKII